MPPAPPVALTIAGSDCSAGAGIQADLKTFSCFGVHGLTAVTAVVAETPNAVHGIYPVEPAALQEQIRILLAAYPVAAIKTGMLGDKPRVVAVSEILAGTDAPLVVDPVMVASTGDALVPADAMAACRERLLPLATVITPNLPEALALLGEAADDHPDPERIATELASRFGCAVLLTGGHKRHGHEAVDILAHDGKLQSFRGPWIPTAGSHGSGCTVSAAITAQIAAGHDLPTAVDAAKEFVTRALAHSYQWNEPGRNPVHALNQLPPRSLDPGQAKGCGPPIS